MDHVISIDESETRATPNARLEALKGRNLPSPYNQRWLGDGGPSKIMDRHLYEATKEGDVEKFMDELEKVSQSRELALSLIFDQVTPSGDSLLHVVASFGKEDVVELILTHFPYLVTRKNSSEDTPLHIAIRTGSLEATRKLIRLRRDSEIMYWKNKDSKSPLYLAVEKCELSKWKNHEGANWEILELLLQEYARDEAYAVKIQGMSPVLAAIEKGKSESSVFIEMIRRPLKLLHVRGEDGGTPLHSAASVGMLEEVVDRLPKLLHVRGEDGGTPLHFAASVGNVGMVELLLGRCPDLALQTDKNGSYPIHIACEGGNVNIIRKLVETWPNLAEIKNKMGQNILHVAAKAGNNDKVKCLLKRYGKPVIIEELVNSKDVDGKTPRDLASMHSHCEIGSFDASELSRLKWIEKEIEYRLVVATLVASVTFTAGITLPSGYNASSDPNPGMPIMLHNRGFQVFIIFNAFATYSSILSVLLLLRARCNRRTRALYFGQAEALLSVAVTFMTVAFLASSIVTVSKLKWLKIFFMSSGIYCAMAIYMFATEQLFPVMAPRLKEWTERMELILLRKLLRKWTPQ